QTFFQFASSRPINDLQALAACIVGFRPNANPAHLSRITTPILVVAGDRDQIAHGAPELIELIPSARLVTIPGRDHLTAVTAREFKHAALEFLSD
ncbi:MAG TPA: alpha/beta hydrolase, partial [Candidatus Dormibacteraeota bacterium]|nr:alpha/beta hydrolase [Candidatus Dormibacteraeota bacterium]